MDEEEDNEPIPEPAIVTTDEVWEIISAQIDVQEQLRTKGQQTLRTLIALVVVTAGFSIATVDYEVPETEIREVANTVPTTAGNLAGTLLWNTFILIFLITISSFSFGFFLGRNYGASQHSTLQPQLGGRSDNPISVIESGKERELNVFEDPRTGQYEEWIEENHRILTKKREILNIAYIDFVICLLSAMLAVYVFLSVTNVAILALLYVDSVLFLIAVVVLIGIWWTRDDQPLSRESWPITEQQKERVPFLNSTEFQILFIIYLPIIVLTVYVLQHYIRAYFSYLF